MITKICKLIAAKLRNLARWLLSDVDDHPALTIGEHSIPIHLDKNMPDGMIGLVQEGGEPVFVTNIGAEDEPDD